MRKIYGILAAAGILLVMLPVSVIAESGDEIDEDIVGSNEYQCMYGNKIRKYKNDDGIDYQWLYRNRLKKCDTDIKPSSVDPGFQVGLRGIWGYSGDNESDGYFGGIIERRNRFGLFKGVYNLSGNESKSRLVGVMRFGYFNGKIISHDGRKCHVTGLYKVEKEEQLFKLRWMTAHNDGWAVAKIVIPED